MRTVRCAGAAGIVLTVWLIGAPKDVAAAAPQHQATLELRVMTYSSLDSADLFLARETAIALLETAGLQVTWRECGGNSCAVPSEAPFLLVRLLPIASGLAPEISGEVVREPTTNHPSVHVYVPLNVEVTQKDPSKPSGTLQSRARDPGDGPSGRAHHRARGRALARPEALRLRPHESTAWAGQSHRHARVNPSVPV